MGGWQNPGSSLVPSGTNSNAPLSTLLPQTQGYGIGTGATGNGPETNLGKSASTLAAGGGNAITTGTSLLANPLDYWQKLLQPPTKQSLTEQQGPAISSVIGQYSTGKKALANAPRGGGTTATAAELPFQESGAITGLLEQQLNTDVNQLQPEAAAAITGIAQSLSQLGLSELGISSQDLQALMANATQQRAQDAAGLGGLGAGIGKIISGLIMAPTGA